MSRRGILVLAAVVGLGLALRLAIVRTPSCIGTDGVVYVQLAEQISAGGSWFHSIFPPGYSLLIALTHSVFGTSLEESACYLSAFSGALAIIPAWFIWSSVFGSAAAGFSCLFLAVWPLAVEYGGGVYTEPLSLLGIFTGLHAWLAHRRGAHWSWGGIAGLCWGGVAWMKPEILAWSGIGGGVLLWQRRYRAGFSLWGVTALVYLPYVLLVHEHTGNWKMAAKQENNIEKAQALGAPDYSGAIERLRDAGVQNARDAPLPGPPELGRRLAINLYVVHRYAVYRSWPPVLSALVAIGFFLAWHRRLLGCWLWLPTAAAIPLLVFVVDARIMHWLFASLGGLAGLPLAYTAGFRRWFLVGLCLFFLLPEALRPVYRSGPDEAGRRAGLWLRGNARSGDVVVDRKPFVAYYAGLPLVWPRPQPGLEGLKQTLAGYESAVLVVDNRYFRNSRPEWFAALACTPPWLDELARFTGPEGHEVRLLVYRRSN